MTLFLQYSRHVLTGGFIVIYHQNSGLRPPKGWFQGPHAGHDRRSMSHPLVPNVKELSQIN